jgi:hypothetical protein
MLWGVGVSCSYGKGLEGMIEVFFGGREGKEGVRELFVSAAAAAAAGISG